jgi:hypothetical protein
MTQRSTISQITGIYRTINENERNKYIYELFQNFTVNDPELYETFCKCEGFGEIPFSWNWKLLVDSMPTNFNFLEVGVYKGRVLGQVGFCAKRTGKTAKLYGVTPLSTATDKYSHYEDSSYYNDIQSTLNKCNVDNTTLELFVGFSQDSSILEKVRAIGDYDMIFIDGCHDYEVVIQDIKNYLPLIKPGGYFIMDDSSLYIKSPFGRFLGHPDVSRAAEEYLMTDRTLEYMFAVGHNRVWKKLKQE